MENTCEMAGCEIEMESIMGDYHIYGDLINREIHCCAECQEEYTNLNVYGRPDYARQWLSKTQEELLDLE